jgi:hypothetical protein
MSTTAKQKATVVIDLSDVVRASSVEKAIHKFCENSYTVASGIVGPAFATSGPGTGWSKQYGVSEWSREAFSGGATAYVDADDGRVLRTEPWEGQDNNGQAVYRDIGGGEYIIGDWSSESEVYVECPDIEDALEYPELAAQMAKSVIDCHHALSDTKQWRELICKIKDAAHYFYEIDDADLPKE